VLRDPLHLRTGQKLGRYELLAPVARGGMGQIWAARLRGARGFHKLVAIKTLLPSPGDPLLMEQRLLDEARIAALIQHSNVVQTLELGEHAGQLYLVMEWVDGEPLGDLIACAEQAGGVPLLVAVNLVAQALRGLQAAHELRDDAGEPLGIVHKDVSPHNVLVTYAGTAKLVDFGIAKATKQEHPCSNEIEGKTAYMPPEQLLGGVVDQRSDLFAMGVILYQLTTGRHPFDAPDAAGVLRNIVSEDPVVRPSLLKPNYSRTLEAVVMKALDKERDRRWPSAEEMRLALQRGMPQAFELGFEAQLRTFMTDTMGERAQRKREALRRAELVVDAGTSDSIGGPSSSSVTSLRAIAIDTDAALRESLPPRPSRLPTLRPLLERSVPLPRLRRPLLLVFGAIAAVLLGVLWLRSAERTASTAATAPAAGMVDLTPVRARAVPSASAASAASTR
jgi:serine/threonine protein kinase